MIHELNSMDLAKHQRNGHFPQLGIQARVTPGIGWLLKTPVFFHIWYQIAAKKPVNSRFAVVADVDMLQGGLNVRVTWHLPRACNHILEIH